MIIFILVLKEDLKDVFAFENKTRSIERCRWRYVVALPTVI